MSKIWILVSVICHRIGLLMPRIQNWSRSSELELDSWGPETIFWLWTSDSKSDFWVRESKFETMNSEVWIEIGARNSGIPYSGSPPTPEHRYRCAALITATHLHHLERRARGAPLPPLTKECNVLLHLYTSTPLHLYAATPPQHDASTPLHLYTSWPTVACRNPTPLDQRSNGATLHFYTSWPKFAWRNSTPLHLWSKIAWRNSTPLHLLRKLQESQSCTMRLLVKRCRGVELRHTTCGPEV